MSTRNLTIPGRMKPAQHKIYALADEAKELAEAIPAGTWRKLALRAAVACSQAKREARARELVERIHEFADKQRRFGKVRL